MANKSAEEKGILLFKHFIQFLELYGAENYGECFEVNWPKVFKFCNSYHLLDFREDLKELLEKMQNHRFDITVGFTYKKFNGDTYDLRTWKLVPAEHKRCPYFELDENMTYEKFIEMYGELV